MKTKTHFYHISLHYSRDEKCFRQKLYRKSKHILCSIIFFFFENRAIYEIMQEIMQKNTEEPDRPQVTIGRMRIACWIPKATNTQTEYVILIAFPLQQWLNELTSVLRYMYSACLVINLSCLPELGSRTNRNMLQNKSSCCMQLVCTVL